MAYKELVTPRFQNDDLVITLKGNPDDLLEASAALAAVFKGLQSEGQPVIARLNETQHQIVFRLKRSRTTSNS